MTAIPPEGVGELRRLGLSDAELVYRTCGDGPPVLLIHGVGLDSRSWRAQVEALSDEFLVITPDLRGHGLSTTDPSTISLDRLAEDLAVILAHETGAVPAHVCGNSLGALVAVHLAVRHPDVVRSLLLSDGWVYNEGSALGVDALAASVQSASMREIAEARVPLVFTPGVDESLVAGAVAVMAEKDHGTYLASARAMWTADLRQHGAHVTVPTLVTAGELDRVAPPAASIELAAVIPGARYRAIPDAGHVPSLERPAAFNRLLSDWISSVDRSGGEPTTTRSTTAD